MQSIDLIRENLQQSEDIVLARIKDMAEHAVVFPTPNGGCHTLWILGHLAFIECLVIQEFMLDAINPLNDWRELFDTEHISPDLSSYPPFDEVLAECRGVRNSTNALLESLREDDLDRPSGNVPAGAEYLFGTYRQCFQYTANHWFMHRGQLADSRKAAGISRMWF